MFSLGEQIVWLIILALPVACISWTVTHEDVFREPREWLAERARTCVRWYERKFCYVWTCEYCFSHYIAAAVVAVFGFWMLEPDWRGYVLAWLCLVAVANVYLSAYGRLRVEIHKEKTEIKLVEQEQASAKGNGAPNGSAPVH